MDDRTRHQQENREKAQREAALGKRARSILKGDLGPVLKRWVGSAIVPTTARLSKCFADHGSLGEYLASPLFGLPSDVATGSELYKVIGPWFLKKGNGEDLVLSVLGTTIAACATSPHGKPIPLTRILMMTGDAARETAMGQFITQVQGAKAMMRVRSTGKASWKQHAQMDSIAALLGGQVRGSLGGMTKEDGEEYPIGGKVVVSVRSLSGDPRRIELRKPAPGDWDLLDIAKRPDGERDNHKGTWASFAMLVLCAAQAELGLFDLREVPREVKAFQAHSKVRNHKGAAGLVLADEAHEGILKDLDKWMRLGFINEPMVVPPIAGDYLTVKHRPVAGGRGPMGHKTQAKDSAAWHVASEVMAATPWTVNTSLLQAISESEFVFSKVCDKEKGFPSPVQREVVLNAHRTIATEPSIYMPLFMDFRGRIYPRTNVVTYQGRDLQKALLCFPEDHVKPGILDGQVAQAMHASNLFSGPDKLDKATLPEREEWYQTKFRPAAMYARNGDWEAGPVLDLLDVADKPLQLLSAMILHGTNRLACQIDGTCNGLQHLTALFRDEKGAPHVNLTASDIHRDKPRDIYATVASLAAGRLEGLTEPWAIRVRQGIGLDRKLTKTSVMVLPYGGTLGTIEDSILNAAVAQSPNPEDWVLGWVTRAWNEGVGGGRSVAEPPRRWADFDAGNYAAFKERPLAEHPLFHSDCKKLAAIVWKCIEETIPKAMQAMQTFRDIAKAIGPRVLEWDTGFATSSYDSLWVTQAKARSDRSTLKFKGFQLPASVRGLSIREGKDEVDGASHTSGIVANFIHSNDAAHLAGTMDLFQFGPGTTPAFGANHDCFMTRPSLMSQLNLSTRLAFQRRYLHDDPLKCAVYVLDPKTGKAEAFASWYDLAKHCGTSFPEDGEWDPREVMDSAWFFS